MAVAKFEDITGKKTEQCGMFIHPERAYLSASPDRLLGDYAILEVKCPHSAKAKEIMPTTVPYLNVQGGDLYLNRDHAYYSQIQGQLMCTDRQICNFVVFTLKDFRIIRVERDEKFCQDMLVKLDAFFGEYFRETLLRRFLYKDYYSYNFQPLRLLPEHIKAFEAEKAKRCQPLDARQ